MKIAQYMLIFVFMITVSSVNIHAWKIRNSSQYYDIQFTITDICNPNDLTSSPHTITEVLKAGGTEYSHTMCGEYKGTNPFSVPETLTIKRYGVGSNIASWSTTINCKKILNDMISAKRADASLKNVDPTWVVVETKFGWDIKLDWNKEGGW